MSYPEWFVCDMVQCQAIIKLDKYIWSLTKHGKLKRIFDINATVAYRQTIMMLRVWTDALCPYFAG